VRNRADRLRGVPAQRLGGRGGTVAATLAAGVILLIGAIVLVMFRSGTKETGSNRMRVYRVLATIHAGQTLCQTDELVPAGTGIVRAVIGPTTDHNADLRVIVRASPGGRVIARGTYRPELRSTVSVSVRPPIRRDTAATVCFATAHGPPYVAGGQPADPGTAAIGAYPIGGDVRIAYFESQPRSWWSFAGTAVERMDAGRRLSGTAIAILVLLLLVGAGCLACAELVRGRP
jgi:hypothetical protein